MKNLISKIIFTILMVVAILAISNNVFAANETYTILQKAENEYVMYLKSSLDKEFEFVYTNDVLENDAKLDYIKNAKDSKDGLPVAYVDSNLYTKYFDGKTATYLWAKNADGYIAKGIKVDLSESVTEKMVELVQNTTKRITVNTDEKDVVEVEKDGIKYTTTTGKIVIKDEAKATYYYTMTDITKSEEYAKLMGLADEINKLDSASTVTKLDKNKEFYDLYTKLLSEVKVDSWVKAENMQIPQPKESKTGDKYVVWVKQETATAEVYDAQFMTCYQEEDKQFVKEEQVIVETSKLPVTYDSVILFVVLAVAVVLFVVLLAVRRKVNTGKHSNK